MNSLLSHELKRALLTQISTIAGIRDIQFQFRCLVSIGVIGGQLF
ncbi:hypothetical protein [Flavobacterium sp. TSSA_36]